MTKGIRIDKKGRIVITDKKLFASIARRARTKGLSLRLPRLTAVELGALGLRPRPSLLETGCYNTMCDCPIRVEKLRVVAKRLRTKPTR